MTERHNSNPYSQSQLMNPVGYADHEPYLWQLNQMALNRTQFLAEPQTHHQHLDVGCGTGGFTLRALVPLSFPARRIMGVDVSPSMLEYARCHDSRGAVAYKLLDIASPVEVSAFVTKIGKFQRVYSFSCFHFVPDLTVAFRNIADLMAADGECLVTAATTCPAVDAWLDLHVMPEWRPWVTDPRMMLSPSFYFNYTGTLAQIEEDTRKCVADAGLECIACEVLQCTWLLPDIEHAFEIYSDCFPVSVGLPSSEKEALKAAYVEHLRPLVKETSSGCEMILTFYRVHARLP
uniref:Putative juvenile hormone acid methyltransferase fat body overexpressed n=1 Tax=Rhipicephalus microplus TaxID=6941 RepID=A0A6M2D554_RHIMP